MDLARTIIAAPPRTLLVVADMGRTPTLNRFPPPACVVFQVLLDSMHRVTVIPVPLKLAAFHRALPPAACLQLFVLLPVRRLPVAGAVH